MGVLICGNCQCRLEFGDEIEPFTVCECAECSSEIVIPLQINNLTLQQPLGSRSVVDIYDGYDHEKNMSSRIYIIGKDNPDYDKLRQLAIDDIVALSKLRHPNIAPIINHGDFDGGYFVTEPKIDGYAMDSYDPATQEPLKIDNVIEIYRLVGKALAFAHHRKVVHHDICPANIHIDARGTIRLKNFFFSKYVYETELQLGMHSSASPYFISPEKVKGEKEDCPGDIFSYGATFYMLLTGVYPFDGSTEKEILDSRVKDAPVEKPKEEEQLDPDEQDVFNTFNSESVPVVGLDNEQSIPYKAPEMPNNIRADIPMEICDLIIASLKPSQAARPRISAILGGLDQYTAMLDKEKGIASAQKQMVLTKTVGINVSAFRKKKKSKGLLSLFKED